MNPLLIIGYGNPLRSDDGVGWRAAQDLLKEWPEEKVRVEPAHQLAPEMAEWVSQSSFVIFVDAWWESIPGRIRALPVHPATEEPGAWTHHLTPEKILALAQSLYGHSPEAVLVSIGGQSFDHGEEFSATLKTAYPDLIKRIKGIVQNSRPMTETSPVNTHA